jgi:hypothetical protein
MLQPLLFTLSLTLAADTSIRQGVAPETTAVPRVLVVQPFVLCGAAPGEAPARMRIREHLVDRVYARAGIDFHFLEPIHYSNPAARDGEINLDRIVEAAREDGAVRGQGDILNTYFVNAVDGRAGPLGRGGMNRPILFIALGPEPDVGVEAFVMAHEAGHCLGLQHSVDDPLVPDDVVNLMGDGPFLERVGVDGLHPSQVETVNRSPMVRPRVLCLDLERARVAILDESFEPFFENLQYREISAFLGRSPEARTLSGQRTEAREVFRKAARGFAPEETKALRWLTEGLRERVADSYPLLAEHPWTFLKFDDELCSGFSHTRGLSILFSERIVRRVTSLHEVGDLEAALREMGPLLVHEQLHVLQRCYPRRFAAMFRSLLGFEEGVVESDPWLLARQVSNPDALTSNWLIPLEEDGRRLLYWPRTLLRDAPEVPRLGGDFLAVAVLVQREGDHYEVVVDPAGRPVHRPLSELGAFLDRFPIRTGHDHPREVAAYLFEQVLLYDILGVSPGDEGPPEMVTRVRDWARDGLR